MTEKSFLKKHPKVREFFVDINDLWDMSKILAIIMMTGILLISFFVGMAASAFILLAVEYPKQSAGVGMILVGCVLITYAVVRVGRRMAKEDNN